MPRTILHIDLDAFFCAVEETRNPELRDKAFAVGGKPDERGVVASCSYAARRMGVRSAMPMSKALRLSPRLIIVSARHNLYSEVSRQVMQRLHDLTSRVEQISIDEAFSISAIFAPSLKRLPRHCRLASVMSCSFPVPSASPPTRWWRRSRPKWGKGLVLSNTRSDEKIAPPNALTIVPPGEESSFLSALPADMLWGVGRKHSHG
jgi:DNA polymerase-4